LPLRESSSASFYPEQLRTTLLTCHRLIASVGATVTGGAYLLSTGPKKADTHGGHEHEAKHDEHSEEDDSKEDTSEDSSDQESEKDSENDSEKKDEKKDDKKGDKKGEPESSHKSAQAGKDVPPPPTDKGSGSEKTDDKKKARDEYQDTVCPRREYTANYVERLTFDCRSRRRIPRQQAAPLNRPAKRPSPKTPRKTPRRAKARLPSRVDTSKWLERESGSRWYRGELGDSFCDFHGEAFFLVILMFKYQFYPIFICLENSPLGS
jgi:hypothetical protein